MIAFHLLANIWLEKKDTKVQKVEKFLYQMRFTDEQLLDVSRRFRLEMHRGLSRYNNHNASVKMLPTYIRSTADGTENGTFLALAIGNCECRALLLVMNPNGKQMVKMEEQYYYICPELKHGSGTQMFDYIAACLGNFLDKLGIKNQKLPLGFTFAFPCKQSKLDESILLTWTKDFKCNGVEHNDVVKLLKTAIQKRGDYDVDIVAAINDTVGTMLSCGYNYPCCEIGLIVGCGTNACYMEEMRNVELVEGDEGRMCINTEWGAFGDNGVLDDIRTEFDVEIDADSVNPGKQVFEKMIGAMYLGELVRLILVQLAKDGLLFQGQTTPELLTRGYFQTSFVWDIEKDKDGIQYITEVLLQNALCLEPSEEDCKATKRVCDIVSSRAADLCAATLVAVLQQMRDNNPAVHWHTTIGVDGTVYRAPSVFAIRLQEKVRKLLPNYDVRFITAEEGCGKGAAIAAAMACRLATKQ